jgi:hypothetical protein
MSGRWTLILAATCLVAGTGRSQDGRSGTLFDRLDANKDGVITRDEMPPRAQQRLDRSGRRSLTREDFERFRARRMQARQRGELTQEQRQLRADRFGGLRQLRLTHPEISRELRELRRQRRDMRLQRDPARRQHPNQPLRSI